MLRKYSIKGRNDPLSSEETSLITDLKILGSISVSAIMRIGVFVVEFVERAKR